MKKIFDRRITTLMKRETTTIKKTRRYKKRSKKVLNLTVRFTQVGNLNTIGFFLGILTDKRPSHKENQDQYLPR